MISALNFSFGSAVAFTGIPTIHGAPRAIIVADVGRRSTHDPKFANWKCTQEVMSLSTARSLKGSWLGFTLNKSRLHRTQRRATSLRWKMCGEAGRWSPNRTATPIEKDGLSGDVLGSDVLCHDELRVVEKGWRRGSRALSRTFLTLIVALGSGFLWQGSASVLAKTRADQSETSQVEITEGSRGRSLFKRNGKKTEETVKRALEGGQDRKRPSNVIDLGELGFKVSDILDEKYLFAPSTTKRSETQIELEELEDEDIRYGGRAKLIKALQLGAACGTLVLLKNAFTRWEQWMKEEEQRAIEEEVERTGTFIDPEVPREDLERKKTSDGTAAQDKKKRKKKDDGSDKDEPNGGSGISSRRKPPPSGPDSGNAKSKRTKPKTPPGGDDNTTNNRPDDDLDILDDLLG